MNVCGDIGSRGHPHYVLYRVQRVFVLFIDVPKEKLKVSLIVLTSSGLVIKVLSLNSSLNNRSLKKSCGISLLEMWSSSIYFCLWKAFWVICFMCLIIRSLRSARSFTYIIIIFLLEKSALFMEKVKCLVKR